MKVVDFCPECGSLLRKRTKDGTKYLVCKCGFEEELELDKKELEKKIQKKKEDLEKNLIIVNQEDKISVHPTVNRICPKCGHDKAEAWQEQTRSADEPSTSFFRCLKCKHTWREY
ncbi:MAG: transcription factor S [Candidatus Lokiarchaeota archaeon]|nr:transcription factor S [Candidatus Lokiarchaeota archaeon]MBD3200432.1 transcription factor S [Candidatus Lokiarchaeota archaeon]